MRGIRGWERASVRWSDLTASVVFVGLELEHLPTCAVGQAVCSRIGTYQPHVPRSESRRLESLFVGGFSCE